MTQRTAFILQVAFAVLALVALGLTVWAFSAYARQWSFVVSTGELLDILGLGQENGLQGFLETRPGRVTAVVVPDEAGPSTAWAIYLPLATTIVSILAFLSTAVLAWRKERRDVKRESLELEHLKLQIEELRRQLEKQGQPLGQPSSGSTAGDKAPG